MSLGKIAFYLMILGAVFSGCENDIFNIEQNTIRLGVTDSWWSSSRVTGEKSGFDTGDRIAVWSWLLKGGIDDSGTRSADVMDACPMVMGAGGEWNYSPYAYWSHDERDKFRFMAIWPYSVTDRVSSSTATGGWPILEWEHSGQDESVRTDLVVADMTANNMYSGSERFLLDFRHILGQFIFKVRIVAPDGSSVTPDDGTGYSALIQQIKITVPQSGRFGFTWSDVEKQEPIWNIFGGTVLLNLLTESPAGIVVDTSEAFTVEDFTCYLLPCTIDRISVTVNNVPRSHELTGVQIRGGQTTCLTLTIVAQENGGFDNALFHATHSRWEKGEKWNGLLQ